MPWRDIVFTADGLVLPPSSWQARTAASTDAVRHRHALAHARCISEEERVLLDSLAPTDWTAAKEDVDATMTITPSISRCASCAMTTTPSISRCSSAAIAITPSTSRRGSAAMTTISPCGSETMDAQEFCLRFDAAPPRRCSLAPPPPADERTELPSTTVSTSALGTTEKLTRSTPMPASSEPAGIASKP
jgi:hypothetical protein